MQYNITVSRLMLLLYSGCVMAVACQLLNVEVLIWSEASPCGFCGEQSGTRQISLRVLGLSHCYCSTSFHTNSSITSLI